MITVHNSDYSVRIITDLSQLSKTTDSFRFPLLNIRYRCTKLREAKYFSKLDRREGYFNIDIDERRSLLTTTTTPKGPHAYKKLALVFKDSAAVFQSLVYHRRCLTSSTLLYLQAPEENTTRSSRTLGRQEFTAQPHQICKITSNSILSLVR